MEGKSAVAGRRDEEAMGPKGAFECVGRFGMAGEILKEISISKEVWADQARLMWVHVVGEMW